MAEIILHEMLDPTASAIIDIAHPLGHLHLHVKAQDILRAPSKDVQMTTHRPQEPLGRVEGIKLLAGEDIEAHQFFSARHSMLVFRDPIEGLQIAQTTFALFDIGLQHIALATLFFMPI